MKETILKQAEDKQCSIWLKEREAKNGVKTYEFGYMQKIIFSQSKNKFNTLDEATKLYDNWANDMGSD